MDFSGAQTLMGTFKTTLLKSVREAAEQRGYVVEGFAPTSRAANQLRDAGISADTLQGFLVRARQPSPDRHLYMVDESSLASTKQVRDFLAKLESGDRVSFQAATRLTCTFSIRTSWSYSGDEGN
jgi:nucleoside-triphosphatase THEP1